jgi:hypothetical protein
MGNLRIILCAESTSMIIGPIRSRCLLMRVGAPEVDEVRVCYWILPQLGDHRADSPPIDACARVVWAIR